MVLLKVIPSNLNGIYTTGVSVAGLDYSDVGQKIITFTRDVSKLDVHVYLLSDGITEYDEVFMGVLSHDERSLNYVELVVPTVNMTIIDYDRELIVMVLM